MNFNNLWMAIWVCMSGLLTAAPMDLSRNLRNGSFEKGELAPWVLRSSEATGEVQAEEAQEGQRALKFVPNAGIEGKHKTVLTQVVPWDPSSKLKPSVWIKGEKLHQARLSIRCFNGLFSESETLKIQDIDQAETWQLVGAKDAIEVPQFTKFVEFNLVIESGVEGVVWVDNAHLSDAPSQAANATSDSTDHVAQQVELLHERLQKEAPKLLILGDASALGYQRFLDKMMEQSGESVMTFGFIGDAPVEKVYDQLRDQQVKIPEGSLVALSFGYQALLNEKQPVQALVSTLKVLAAWMESQGARVRVLGLVDQDQHVPSHWQDLSAAFHEVLSEDGTLKVIQALPEDRERSAVSLLEPNHLPNHEAKLKITTQLLKALEELKKSHD